MIAISDLKSLETIAGMIQSIDPEGQCSVFVTSEKDGIMYRNKAIFPDSSMSNEAFESLLMMLAEKKFYPQVQFFVGNTCALFISHDSNIISSGQGCAGQCILEMFFILARIIEEEEKITYRFCTVTPSLYSADYVLYSKKEAMKKAWDDRLHLPISFTLPRPGQHVTLNHLDDDTAVTTIWGLKKEATDD